MKGSKNGGALANFKNHYSTLALKNNPNFSKN
jgi:hypothetical protein